MTTEPIIDRARLRELAEAATRPAMPDYEFEMLVTRESHELVAACDPYTVLDLLDALDRAAAQVAELREALEQKESQMRSLLLLPRKYDLNDYARLRIAIENHVEVGCITGHTGQNLVDALSLSAPVGREVPR